MSHNIRWETYPEKVNKSEVQAEWDDYAHHEDWREGCSGLGSDIRWINHVCDSYDDAVKYIESHDRGFYDQLAVKYRSSVKPTTKAYENLISRRNEIFATLKEREKVHYSSANTKSEYVTCRNCGSRLATKYIKSNNCPLCRAELRPTSALNAIETSKRMLKETNKKIKEIEIKASKKAEIKWLVKIEYHT